MSAAKRKVYGAAFKGKVGLEAIRGLKTINEIAQEHGVHPAQVGQWKKAILEQVGTLFEGKRGPQPIYAHSDPEHLYSEIGRLKVELDWLKKSPECDGRDSADVDRTESVDLYSTAVSPGWSGPSHGLRGAATRKAVGRGG